MKPGPEEKVQQMLKSAKLYHTKCRAEILKILAETKKPLSQEMISQKLGRNRFNKVTIYRTLESFCRVGLVHTVFIDKRATHFELGNRCKEIRCHPHFTCKSCGVTNCLTGLSVPVVKGLKKGFVIHRQQVRLEGLCPQCS